MPASFVVGVHKNPPDEFMSLLVTELPVPLKESLMVYVGVPEKPDMLATKDTVCPLATIEDGSTDWIERVGELAGVGVEVEVPALTTVKVMVALASSPSLS